MGECGVVCGGYGVGEGGEEGWVVLSRRPTGSTSTEEDTSTAGDTPGQCAMYSRGPSRATTQPRPVAPKILKHEPTKTKILCAAADLDDVERRGDFDDVERGGDLGDLELGRRPGCLVASLHRPYGCICASAAQPSPGAVSPVRAPQAVYRVGAAPRRGRAARQSPSSHLILRAQVCPQVRIF